MSFGRRDDDDALFFAQVSESIGDLNAWISQNGWEGYDPYDIKGTAVFVWALRLSKDGFLSRLKRKVILGPLIIGEALFPRFLRFVSRVKPMINAKGMGLLAKAYLQLYQTTGREDYKAQGVECLQWLSRNVSAGYEYACWGYPFDWQNYVFVPAGTPASVVTAAGCDAFWMAWKVLGGWCLSEGVCGNLPVLCQRPQYR